MIIRACALVDPCRVSRVAPCTHRGLVKFARQTPPDAQHVRRPTSGICERSVRLVCAVIAIISGCSHPVRVNDPVVPQSSNAPVPLSIDLAIDQALRDYKAHASTYAGVVHHRFEVPIGAVLSDTLERTARGAFAEVDSSAARRAQRPTLVLALSGSPVLSIQWQQGLVLVGQRTDCVVSVEARLIGETGETIWQAVATGQGHHETGRLANWPTAGQAEPAVRGAIEQVATDLQQKLTTAPDIARYASHRRSAPSSLESVSVPSAQAPATAVRVPEEPTRSPGATATRLQELEQMRREHLISEGEYRAKRQAILNEL
jgi:hypothetical protein